MGSIGNVPLAVVLWGSGFAFAGIIAFIYADLIVPQLIRIYLKIFGTRIGTKLSLILFVSMASTGFIVYYLFEALDLVPVYGEIGRGAGLTLAGFSPGTLLNGLFLLISAGFGLLLVTGKGKTPGDRIVQDPVSGAELTVAKADFCSIYDESIYYFEEEKNRDEFKASPKSFLNDKDAPREVE